MNEWARWFREFLRRNGYAVAIGIIATLALSLFLEGDLLHDTARKTFLALRLLFDALL